MVQPIRALRRPKPGRSPVSGRARAQASTEADGQVYEGARRSGTFMAGWPTRLQSADRDYFPARPDIVGRTRDVARNNPIGASIVGRKKNQLVGKGWRFSSKPNARALGITHELARELGNVINTEWSLYANSYDFIIDAERRGNWGQLLRMAADHLLKDAEALAQVDYADDDPVARYKTCLRMIDPDRLGNPMGQPDSDILRAGVEMNDRGVPVAYHIRERHAFDMGVSDKSFRWARHPRYSTPLGRPNILHVFDRERAGQTRGVSKFASTLKSFRGFERFTDATIQAATINALWLGFIKSSAGPEAVSDAFGVQDMADHEEEREGFYKKNPVELGGAIMPVLPLGDEITLATASKDVTSFEAFSRSIIRLIAAALGATYEEASMDFSQTNYSSIRAAMIHAWADIVAMFGLLESQFVKPFFVAWLEEAFDTGRIVAPEGAPGFYDAIDAYAEGRWLGPGRGYIDQTKEILAAAARIEAGVSTLELECAEQGHDYEEILDQRAHEKKMRKDRDLEGTTAGTESELMAGQSPTTGPAPEDQRPTPAKSALAAIAAFADSPEHEASLDRRPTA